VRAPLKYLAWGAGGVAAVILVLWPVLDPTGRRGLLIAAAIALPVQILAFAGLVLVRGRLNGFLAVWVGGTLLRVSVIAVTAFVAIRSGTEGLAPLLLGLAGFFFGLLLLEPVFFRSAAGKTT
jgi:hypothetical protein